MMTCGDGTGLAGTMPAADARSGPSSKFFRHAARRLLANPLFDLKQHRRETLAVTDAAMAPTDFSLPAQKELAAAF